MNASTLDHWGKGVATVAEVEDNKEQYVQISSPGTLKDAGGGTIRCQSSGQFGLDMSTLSIETRIHDMSLKGSAPVVRHLIDVNKLLGSAQKTSEFGIRFGKKKFELTDSELSRSPMLRMLQQISGKLGSESAQRFGSHQNKIIMAGQKHASDPREIYWLTDCYCLVDFMSSVTIRSAVSEKRLAIDLTISDTNSGNKKGLYYWRPGFAARNASERQGPDLLDQRACALDFGKA
eukprot:s2729_g5.t1